MEKEKFTPSPALEEVSLDWIIDYQLGRDLDVIERKIHRLTRFAIYKALNFKYDMHVTGTANIPEEGSFVGAINHTLDLDVFFAPIPIVWETNRMVYGLSKIENFTELEPLSKLPFWPWLLARIGLIPIGRHSTRKEVYEYFDKVRQLISMERIFFLAPEGTRSKDGSLGKLNTGIVEVIKDTFPPIPPIAIIRHPMTGAIYVNIGQPMVGYEKHFMAEDGGFKYTKPNKQKFVNELRERIGALYTITYPHLACNLLVQAVEQGHQALHAPRFQDGLIEIAGSLKEQGYYLEDIVRVYNRPELEKAHEEFVEFCINKGVLHWDGEDVLRINPEAFRPFSDFKAEFWQGIEPPIPYEQYSRAMNKYKKQYPVPYAANHLSHLGKVVGIIIEQVNNVL